MIDLDASLAAHGLPATEGRHPLPEPADFARAMGDLGVGDDTVVVAYDHEAGKSVPIPPATRAQLVACMEPG
mgnify:FL=1